MKRAKIGDVYSIKVPNGYKLYQWAYSIPKKGDYIRVFEGLFASIPDNLSNIVTGPHSYIIAFDTKKAYRIGLAQMLDNFPVPDAYPFPNYMLALHPGKDAQIGAIVVQSTSSTDGLRTNQWFRTSRISDLPPHYQNITLLNSHLTPSWLLYLFDSNFTLLDLNKFFPCCPGENSSVKLQKYTDIVNEALMKSQTDRQK